MAGNSLGKEFVITTFGESHGKIVGVVIDGCPAGLPLQEKDFQEDLDNRIPAQPNIVSARIEKDRAKILSGTFNGFTTGAPIAITVENKEINSSDYDAIKDKPRPAHSDLPARIRFGGFNDYRGGGRFSGRVTVALILAGVIAKKLLSTIKVEILAYTKAIGNIETENPTLEDIRKNRFNSPVRCPNSTASKLMEDAIIEAKKEGDSLGGIVECITHNMPVGVGEPLFEALDADIAKAIFGVSAVKGVEFGVGFRAAELKGSENNDQYEIKKNKVSALTNNAGGILGGLTSGMPIIVRAAIKPTPSIAKQQQTVDLAKNENAPLTVKGRHDPCIVPKAVLAIEAVVAVTLVDHLKRAGFIPIVLKEHKNNG